MGMPIPDGDPINDALREVEQHLENINELLPGLEESVAEDVLMQVLTAAASLEEAHSYITGEDSPYL